LEELTDGHKRTLLTKERLWFLKLDGAFRNNFELRIKDSRNTSQEFALIITIKDTKNRGKVYDEVTNLLSQFNFVHENIKVDARVTINN
jgi:hypothetical protein